MTDHECMSQRSWPTNRKPSHNRQMSHAQFADAGQPLWTRVIVCTQQCSDVQINKAMLVEAHKQLMPISYSSCEWSALFHNRRQSHRWAMQRRAAAKVIFTKIGAGNRYKLPKIAFKLSAAVAPVLTSAKIEHSRCGSLNGTKHRSATGRLYDISVDTPVFMYFQFQQGLNDNLIDVS